MENGDKNNSMDERIVKINAILSTKLSAISKNKREGLKAQKSSCKFLLENWDSEEHLLHFVEDSDIKEKQYELWCIGKSRIYQLQFIKRQEERKKIDLKELSEFKGNPADLSKDANQCWAILHGYYDTDSVMQDKLKEDELFASAMEYRKKMIADAVRGLKIKKSVKATGEHKEAANKQQKQTKHNVGDLHPNGKWVWTEYQPGKFDWRGIPKNGTTPKQPKEKTAAAPKVKTATKAKKQAEKPVKVRTIEEILATKPQGISKPQERVFKLLRKGYRFIDGGAGTMTSYLKKGDDQQTATLDVVGALFNRMRVIPEEMNQFKA